MKDGRSALLVALAGAIGGASASAQITTDPTRPPAAVAAETPRGAVAGNQLQSVMISPTRKAAIINGAVVELGGKYGDAVLTKVAEDEVVLESGSGRQVLRMHPGVDKKVQVVQAAPLAPAVQSAPPEPKPKPKAKAKPKAKTKPKAGTQGEAKPAAESSAGTR